MKIRMLTFAIVFSLTFFGSQTAFAGSQKRAVSNAMHEMAKIMSHLNHFPSEAEKETLLKIIKNDSTTMRERMLAKSMHNLEHKATEPDKKKLSEIMEDESAPTHVRDMASIIFTLTHKPSATDKEKLSQMLK